MLPCPVAGFVGDVVAIDVRIAVEIVVDVDIPTAPIDVGIVPPVADGRAGNKANTRGREPVSGIRIGIRRVGWIRP